MCARRLVGIGLVGLSAACSSVSGGKTLLDRFLPPGEDPRVDAFSLAIPAPPDVLPAAPLRVTAPPERVDGGTDGDDARFRRDPATGRVPELKTVYFDFDSADLTEAARAELRTNALWLLEHTDREVQIQGHCDERGTVEYNFNLGQRRADAVKMYLTNLGINVSRIHTISYGEERPIATGHDEGSWRLNRRTEFHVY